MNPMLQKRDKMLFKLEEKKLHVISLYMSFGGLSTLQCSLSITDCSVINISSLRLYFTIFFHTSVSQLYCKEGKKAEGRVRLVLLLVFLQPYFEICIEGLVAIGFFYFGINTDTEDRELRKLHPVTHEHGCKHQQSH